MDESKNLKTPPPHQQPTINMGQLLMDRHKKLQQQQNVPKSNQVASTPANIKRLQVNKWFNSPTDLLVSPCTKKLYKKNFSIQAVNFDDDNDNDDDGDKNVKNIDNIENNIDSKKSNV